MDIMKIKKIMNAFNVMSHALCVMDLDLRTVKLVKVDGQNIHLKTNVKDFANMNQNLILRQTFVNVSQMTIFSMNKHYTVKHVITPVKNAKV